MPPPRLLVSHNLSDLPYYNCILWVVFAATKKDAMHCLKIKSGAYLCLDLIAIDLKSALN